MTTDTHVAKLDRNWKDLGNSVIISYMGEYLNYSPLPIKEVKVEDVKKCTKCGNTKYLTEFYKDKNRRGGRSCWCKKCQREYLVKYREEHSEHILESNIKWRKEHSAQWLEYMKKYRESNKEKINSQKKAYYQTKRGKASKNRGNYKRRIFSRSFINNLTATQWEEIKKSQNNKCAHCGKPEPEIKLTIDHIVPVSKGGNHIKENIQGLCQSCNSKKNCKIDNLGFQNILGGLL